MEYQLRDIFLSNSCFEDWKVTATRLSGLKSCAMSKKFEICQTRDFSKNFQIEWLRPKIV